MGKIRNYTSTVPASQSIADIQRKIVDYGATDITISYNENKRVAGLKFRMMIEGQAMFFELPANVEACYRRMRSEYKMVSKEKEKDIWDQAERTAWKLQLEWVHIQLSLIEMKQVAPLQVLLAYVIDPGTGKTVYDRLKSDGFKALLPASDKPITKNLF